VLKTSGNVIEQVFTGFAKKRQAFYLLVRQLYFLAFSSPVFSDCFRYWLKNPIDFHCCRCRFLDFADHLC